MRKVTTLFNPAVWLFFTFLCFSKLISSDIFLRLRFVDSAIGHGGNLFRSSPLATDISHLVQSLDPIDDVSEYPCELGVHVRKDNAELGSNL